MFGRPEVNHVSETLESEENSEASDDDAANEACKEFLRTSDDDEEDFPHFTISSIGGSTRSALTR
ncbi:hypothetical protein TWF481_002704 [Arthrobotrys musiformis]|uniref:Uncharacterized protein n=1 Tax=Arthrobotrys musiformis TaxID=47236 RepID=A0AAV9VSY1_9PEZI